MPLEAHWEELHALARRPAAGARVTAPEPAPEPARLKAKVWLDGRA